MVNTMNADEIGQQLGDILGDMLRAEKIIMKVNEEYDPIRADRRNKGMYLYDSDKCLQDSFMCLIDAIMYIKHEINMLDGEE